MYGYYIPGKWFCWERAASLRMCWDSSILNTSPFPPLHLAGMPQYFSKDPIALRMKTWGLAGLVFCLVFIYLGFFSFNFCCRSHPSRWLKFYPHSFECMWNHMEIYSEISRHSFLSGKNTVLTAIQGSYNTLYDVKKASKVEFNYSKLQCMLKKPLTIFFLSWKI